MKTAGIVALAALIMGSAGCASESETQTRQEGIPANGITSPGDTVGLDDAALTAKIKTAYVANPELSAVSIHVEPVDGVVTLTGTVDSDTRKDLAEQVARNTEGVREVRNQLIVEVAGAKERTPGQVLADAAITASVKTSLIAAKGVQAHEIDVDTNNGTVTLSGTVRSPAEIDLAVRAAEKVDGVRKVVNNIGIGGS